MDPEAVQNLLLNLKLQLLALPNLAKWSLLTFAGIFVFREAITLGWNVYKRRKMDHPDEGPSHVIPTADCTEESGPKKSGQAALPAPDPFAAPHFPQEELDAIRVRTPPAGMESH